MKFLSLDLIKAHVRIDSSCEDSLLELYGEAAEKTTLNFINMTYDEVVEKYGEFPMPLIQASLILVDTSYQWRNPVSQYIMYAVPYTFDLLIKPYAKL